MIVKQANYIKDYIVRLSFSDGSMKDVDFGVFLKKRSHPQWNKYNDLSNFKQFKIENGNIVWGEDWDLIFPINQLYNGKIKC